MRKRPTINVRIMSWAPVRDMSRELNGKRGADAKGMCGSGKFEATIWRGRTPLPPLRPQKKESPPESHDKAGQATVATFRSWRGLRAGHPWSLAEARTLRGAQGLTSELSSKKN